MNTTFNFNRLVLLLKRYFIENKQHELTFWGITTFIFMIMHQTGSVEMFLYITGLIFAARTFKIFNFTPGGMHYLLIPATHTEKLTVNILLSIVYFFVMILITYIIGTIVGTTLGNLIFNLNNPIHLELFSDSISNQWNHQTYPHVIFDTFMSFALIQSIFILGSIYFKGNAIGKTLLTLIALSVIMGLIEVFILKISFNTYHLDGQMLTLMFPEVNHSFKVFEIIIKIFKYCLIPFLWIVSYFRLTEKQV